MGMSSHNASTIHYAIRINRMHAYMRALPYLPYRPTFLPNFMKFPLFQAFLRVFKLISIRLHSFKMVKRVLSTPTTTVQCSKETFQREIHSK